MNTARWLFVAFLVVVSLASVMARDLPGALWLMLVALVVKP